MDFYEVLDQVIDLLRTRGRVSYRALKRQFNLDDDYLEDLKVELVKSQRLAVDEDGDVLVWTGDTASIPAPVMPICIKLSWLHGDVPFCALEVRRSSHRLGVPMIYETCEKSKA